MHLYTENHCLLKNVGLFNKNIMHIEFPFSLPRLLAAEGGQNQTHIIHWPMDESLLQTLCWHPYWYVSELYYPCGVISGCRIATPHPYAVPQGKSQGPIPTLVPSSTSLRRKGTQMERATIRGRYSFWIRSIILRVIGVKAAPLRLSTWSALSLLFNAFPCLFCYCRRNQRNFRITLMAYLQLSELEAWLLPNRLYVVTFLSFQEIILVVFIGKIILCGQYTKQKTLDKRIPNRDSV